MLHFSDHFLVKGFVREEGPKSLGSSNCEGPKAVMWSSMVQGKRLLYIRLTKQTLLSKIHYFAEFWSLQKICEELQKYKTIQALLLNNSRYVGVSCLVFLDLAVLKFITTDQLHWQNIIRNYP